MIESRKLKYKKLFKDTSSFLLKLVPSVLSPRINLNST